MILVLSLLLAAAAFAALAADVFETSRASGRRSAWALVAGLVAGVCVVAAPGTASAAGDVVVTVQDASGAPVEGAFVTYDDPAAFVQATDVNGETTWPGLDPGNVDFEVVSSWWDELGAGPVTVVDGSSVPLTITADPEPALVDVEIVVEDLASQPIEDPAINGAFTTYTVYVYAGENEFGLGPDFATDSFVSGDLMFPGSSVTLSGVPVGDRFVDVFRHGAFGGRRLYTGPLTVSANPTQATVQIPTPTQGDVQIDVIDQDGLPVDGAKVLLSLDAPENLPNGLPDDGATGGGASLGTFFEFGLPADTYLATVNDDDVGEFGSTTVTVTAVGTATGTITTGTGDVVVSVVDGAGAPVTQYVDVRPFWGSLTHPVDGSGVATIIDAPIGVQTFVALDPWFNELGSAQVTVVQSPAGPTPATIVVDPVPEYGALDVHVEDSSGSPLEGFNVFVDNSPLPPTIFIDPEVTDSSGAAFFEPVPVGTYDVTVEDLSGFSQTESVTITANATTPLTVIGPAAPAFGDVTVTVNDDAGNPAPFVYVEWVEGFFGQFADGSGQVTFMDLPEGVATFTVDDFVLGVGSTTATVVANTTANATVDLTAPVLVDVNITVEDPLGDPVEGVAVSLGIAGSATTDPGGVAAFTDVPTGDRVVDVFDDVTGYLYATTTVTVQADPTDATIVIPTPTFGDIEIEVVDDVNGNPVPNVSVFAVGESALTGATGTATFSGLPAGLDWFADLYDLTGSNYLGTANATVVANTTTMVQVPVTAPATGSIAVDVSDGAGAPVVGAEVHLFNLFNTCDPTLLVAFCSGALVEPTGVSGDVTLGDIPVGDHRIVVIDNGVVVFDGVATVTSGNQTTVSVTAAFGSLDVTVTEGGQPVAGVNAIVTYVAGTATVMTDSTGVASFPVVPVGGAGIEIQTQLGTPLANGSTTITDGAPATETFAVTVPTPQAPKAAVSAGTASTVQNPETGQFTVSMVNGDRSDVTLEFDATCLSGSTPTAVTVFYGMDLYTPTVIGSGPGYTVTIPEANLGSGAQVTVETVCDGVAEYDDLGRIVLYDPSGLVTDAVSGAPVVGAEVYLYRVPGWAPRMSSADNSTPMTCETNESKAPGAPWMQPAPVGEGVLEPANSLLISPQVNPFVTDGVGYYGWDVAQGCWYVTIDAPGYDPYVSPVVGVPSEVTDLDVALQPTPTVPGAPTGVTAVVSSSSDTSIDVGWTAPTDTGNSPLTGYTVSTTPSSAGCSTAGATTCTVGDLTPETTYTVTVVATNAVGNSPASSAATVTTPKAVVAPVDGPDLIGVEPARLLETRPEATSTVDGKSFGGGAVGDGAFVEVVIAGRGGVPEGASAAMLNLTTVRPTGKGFATLYPCGDRPTASSLNFVAGSNVANATFVQLSDEGSVCVFTSRETHLILDVVGFTTPV